MANEPWFKFYAADYLLDAGVDSLPLDAQAILLRMWCLCHIEGSCPADTAEIARKTRLTLVQIGEHFEKLNGFFKVRDGRLCSPRMEAEKLKSVTARRNGQKRGEQIRSANRSADGSAQSQTQSQSQSQCENLSPSSQQVVDISLQKRKTEFSQSDFDERDLRKFADARREVELKLAHGWGSNLTNDQIFDYQCARAGVTPKHMREVVARVEQEDSA